MMKKHNSDVPHLRIREGRLSLLRCLQVCVSLVVLCITTISAADEIVVDVNNASTAAAAADDTVSTKKTERSWTLFHRILTSGSIVENTSSSNIHPSSLEWKIRGTIHLSVIDPTVTTTTKSSSSDMIESVQLEIINDENALSESFIDDVRKLDAITNTTTWYQLKLEHNNNHDQTKKKTGSTTTQQQQQLVTSVPSCHVLRSNFRDEMLIHFQSSRNSNIISFTYMPYISRFAPKTCMDYYPPLPPILSSNETTNTTTTTSNTPKFISKISWETAVPGMVVGKPSVIDPITQLPITSTMKVKPPPGYHWFANTIARKTTASLNNGGSGSSNNPNDDGTDEEQAKPDNTPFGFFRRYYYIFIPLMILNIMNSLNPPQTPPSDEQQRGTAAGVVAGTSAAATIGSGSVGQQQQVRNRRGKKD